MGELVKDTFVEYYVGSKTIIMEIDNEIFESHEKENKYIEVSSGNMLWGIVLSGLVLVEEAHLHYLLAYPKMNV